MISLVHRIRELLHHWCPRTNIQHEPHHPPQGICSCFSLGWVLSFFFLQFPNHSPKQLQSSSKGGLSPSGETGEQLHWQGRHGREFGTHVSKNHLNFPNRSILKLGSPLPLKQCHHLYMTSSRPWGFNLYHNFAKTQLDLESCLYPYKNSIVKEIRNPFGSSVETPVWLYFGLRVQVSHFPRLFVQCSWTQAFPP